MRSIAQTKTIAQSNGDGNTQSDSQHSIYMKRAIELARKGAGWTAPNPMVGAVIVKDGRVIGEGYHEKCGQLHAERNAIASLTESAEGATMYVTLEPCCHYGKTPPCTEAIVEQRIARVFIGSRDPNPLVAGKGVTFFREHGVEVIEDFMRTECDDLNPVFFHYITTKSPYVVMKYAMTLDGKIATRTGASQWITGETARAHVQTLRGRYASILAGIGTVLADDPLLNCRREGAHQPLRIIVDSRLRIPLDSRILQTAGEYPTLIVCAANIDSPAEADISAVDQNAASAVADRASAIRSCGAEVISLPGGNGRVSMKLLMEYLGKRQIDSVLVEGGGEIHEACREAGIVNHICCYIAPKLLGGAGAKTPVEGLGSETMEDATLLSTPAITLLGEDILLECDVKQTKRRKEAASCLPESLKKSASSDT
ncbi:MAG: bifunctional diaminohydroxyphosphoribosylaminopyrimidine deaminase/5-amino-6-(5-phosphoribosylamino)uracil reductase RibD [Firmicutes bacterium]|nr:bifunctional diaminohydroxyphosphoribosylaminopyrimidine deaminase/5-amino-6-(5-phosphoribosylamino)uracil reductase RibD [Bacillota bacterium]